MTTDPPPLWSATTLGELIEGFQAGRNLKANGHPAQDGEYGVLKISAVTWGEFRASENKALAPGDAPKTHEIVRAGDLLISRANTSELVGAVVRVEADHPRLMLPDKILRLLVNERKVDPDFLLYALRTRAVREHFEREATGTSDSMRNLSQPKMCSTPILVAPRSQQRRIVEKIEALTGKSRRAKEALDAIPLLLERFRQSVLAAAFRGDLTKDWREQNPDVEPADQLLARIRRERRARWEQAELERLRAKGKVQKNDEWKKKYVEPQPADVDGLHELPDGWCWSSLDEIVYDGPRNGYSPLCSDDGEGPLVLKLSATTQGSMVLSPTALKRATRPVDPALDCWLCDGDVLIQRANTLELVGATAVYYGPARTYVYPDLMMRVRIADDALRTLAWRYLNGRAARHFLQSHATGTAGNMPKINSATVRACQYPFRRLLSARFSLVASKVRLRTARRSTARCALRSCARRGSINRFSPRRFAVSW